MSEYEFTISLRIRHPTVDPETITAALGIEPQHTWRAGHPRCDPAGAKLGGAHYDSYWMGRLMASGGRPRRSSWFAARGASLESKLTRAPLKAPRSSSAWAKPEFPPRKPSSPIPV